MNREIKFRIWDKEQNKFIDMFYNSLYINQEGKITGISTVGEEIDTGDRYVLQQYTGLKDKNGKEIYEGDIIKLSASDNSPDVEDVGEVIFNTDNSLSGLEWGLLTKNGYLKTDFLGEKEVIGNVFENPELLK